MCNVISEQSNISAICIISTNDVSQPDALCACYHSHLYLGSMDAADHSDDIRTLMDSFCVNCLGRE